MGGFNSQELDPRTGGPLEARETVGGDFLYYFHFDLRAPGRLRRWLICFAAIVMLVAIISGVITHRRIFVDFFTFRPSKWQRSWLDAHNVAGVAALSDRKHARFDDVRSVAIAIETVRAGGIDELIGGAMNGRLLGNVQPYRDVVQRGIAELAALHANLRVP